MINEARQKLVKVNGVQLAYNESGTGGHTIIFIHGFPFNKSMWDAQLEAFAGKHRVIAFDLRGFGASESGPEKMSIDLFASDLIQFIDVLGTGKVTACGLSMGGYVLMNAVSRAPEKFSRIILADTQCIADSEEGKVKRLKAIEKVNADGLEAYAEGYVQNVFAKSSIEKKISAVDHAKKMITGTTQKTVTSTLQALADRKETCNNLKNVKIPALIICGREDTVTPLSQAELLNNTIAGSTLRIIENAGHMSNLENPAEFNKAVQEFLKG
jgi:3-oxoadipate enol-lactonase